VYAPAIQKEREIIEKTGAQVLWMHGEEAHSGSHSKAYGFWRLNGGGALIGKGVHPLTAALYLKRVEGRARHGKPIRPAAVSARMHSLTRLEGYADRGFLRTDYHDVEDFSATHVVFEDGTVADIFASEIVMGGIHNWLEVMANNHRAVCNINPNTAMQTYNPSEDQFRDIYVVEKIGTKQGWAPTAPDEDFITGFGNELTQRGSGERPEATAASRPTIPRVQRHLCRAQARRCRWATRDRPSTKPISHARPTPVQLGQCGGASPPAKTRRRRRPLSRASCSFGRPASGALAPRPAPGATVASPSPHRPCRRSREAIAAPLAANACPHRPICAAARCNRLIPPAAGGSSSVARARARRGRRRGGVPAAAPFLARCASAASRSFERARQPARAREPERAAPHDRIGRQLRSSSRRRRRARRPAAGRSTRPCASPSPAPGHLGDLALEKNRSPARHAARGLDLLEQRYAVFARSAVNLSTYRTRAGIYAGRPLPPAAGGCAGDARRACRAPR
jgi:hypothetical protein